MSSFSISIVIPAFNEVDRLPTTLDRVTAFLNKNRWDAEIVVVDDGSTDATSQIAKNYSQEYPIIRPLALKKNRGKGAALGLGVASAEKEWVLLYDADGATPIEELLRFQEHMTAASQILIASRDIESSHRVVRQPFLRHKLGRVFVLFRKWLVGLKNIEDTQCGFKLIRAASAKRLFQELKTPGWLFDVEILGRADILGMPIQELGVRWFDVPKIKVKVPREIPKILSSLWSIRRALRQFKKEQAKRL